MGNEYAAIEKRGSEIFEWYKGVLLKERLLYEKDSLIPPPKWSLAFSAFSCHQAELQRAVPPFLSTVYIDFWSSSS